MGAVLAIIISELQNTNTQEQQEVVTTRGVRVPCTWSKSITPELHTSLVYVDRTYEESYNEGCIYVERIREDLDEDYQVRLRDGVRIIIEREIATQTPKTFENSSNSQFSLWEPPSLTSTDISKIEGQDNISEENSDEIYNRQILYVLKESMYDLFQE